MVPSSFPSHSGTSNASLCSNGNSSPGRNLQPTLAFIGEAPGRNEIAKQEVFIGVSGQLLNAVLDAYGVRREDVFLGNATLCHYPDSMKSKKGGVPEEAIVACRPRLMEELTLAGVDTVVPMGNSAVTAVVPDLAKRSGITKLRVGRPKTLQHGPTSLLVVPTFHPAACLRRQEQFPQMLTDIGKAVSTMNLPDLWYEPQIEVINASDPDALDILAEMHVPKDNLIFLDIETSREKDISYGNIHMNRVLCVGIGPEDSDIVYVFTEECFKNPLFRVEFIKMLEACKIGAQNGKFDLGALRAYLGYPDFEGPKLSEDTMLQSYALHEYAGVHGLEYMGMELLGTDDWKHVIHPYLKGPTGKGPTDYANIPPDILHKYNAFDVHATRLLHRYFDREIDARGLRKAYEFMLRVSNMLQFVEPRGLGFDREYSQELADQYAEERKDLERGLPTVCDPEAKGKHLRVPHKLNVDSPDQVHKYFKDAGIDLDDTEADTLRPTYRGPGLSDEVRATTQLILDIRAITKMDGTFVTGLRKRTTSEGTVHPSFLIHGTTSGRLSARNPNSQNIPRAEQIKRQFVARSVDRTLVGVDMSQAELRVLTWLAREELTRDIFNDPTRDLFVELCRSMFPDRYPATLTDKEVKKLSSHESPGEPSIRTLVKTFAYGIAYGRTAAGIAADPQFNMDVRVAQKHMKVFEKTIPNIIAFLEEAADQACRGEALITPFGRQRRFFLVTPQNRHAVRNEAKSFYAQSIASDIVLEAACRLTQQHHIFIVNLVHDAIYADVLKEDAEKVRDLIARTMIEVAEEVTEGYVKFAAEGKIGRSWADV
jgi:uracil-DNA glycosylase family 4